MKTAWCTTCLESYPCKELFFTGLWGRICRGCLDRRGIPVEDAIPLPDHCPL